MIPPATATAPLVMCKSRMRSAPMAKITRAVTTAVRTISRPVARCSSGDMPLVLSRNGTSAIFGPSPISRSSRSLATSSMSMLPKSMVLPSPGPTRRADSSVQVTRDAPR